MAAAKKKRGADNYLTDQNWDREDDDAENQEAGTFKQANDEILSKRTFKKAKRRAGTDNDEVKKSNPFSGFGGFGSSPFSFGAKPSEQNNNKDLPKSTDSTAPFSFGTKPLGNFNPPNFTDEQKSKNNAPITGTASPFSFGIKPAAIGVDENTSKSTEIAAPFNFGTKSLESVNSSQSTTDKINGVQNFWGGADSNKEKSDFFASRGESKVEQKSEPKKLSNSPKTNQTESPKQTKQDPDKGSIDKDEKIDNDAYLEQLVSLNHSVLAWIKQHVEKNPCLDLTPVFKDYEKHMKEIDVKHNRALSTNDAVQKSSSNSFKTPDGTHASPITFGTTTTKVSTLFGTTTPIQSKGKTTPISSVTAAPKIPSMFASSTPIQSNSVFSVEAFNSGNLFTATPFSTSNDHKKQESKGDANSIGTTVSTSNVNEEGETQPEPERKTIVEDDAFYQIRCKLFFKKGTEWKELGIGMLYLKPAGEKIQLLVRMETATGKILLNISVTNEMPISRSGKNNIMLVSTPNPPVYSKPTDGDNSVPCTYLIRVKGTTEADELFGKLKSN